jgi:hypothetical protein
MNDPWGEFEFKILPDQEYLFNGNMHALREPYLGILRQKLEEKGFHIEQEGAAGRTFDIDIGGDHTIVMYLTMNFNEAGNPAGKSVVLDAHDVHHEGIEHRDTVVSIIQDFINTTPRQEGGRRKGLKSRKSRKSRKARRGARKTRGRK